jgi:hypothetical protein
MLFGFIIVVMSGMFVMFVVLSAMLSINVSFLRMFGIDEALSLLVKETLDLRLREGLSVFSREVLNFRGKLLG